MHGRTKRWFEFLICQYLIWQATCLFDTYLSRWCKNSSYQATENSKELLYLSDGAALTRGHRLDGWNHRNAFMVLETGSLRSGCQHGWVLFFFFFLRPGDTASGPMLRTQWQLFLLLSYCNLSPPLPLLLPGATQNKNEPLSPRSFLSPHLFPTLNISEPLQQMGF